MLQRRGRMNKKHATKTGPGTLPVSWLFPRSSRVRLVRAPRHSGMGPAHEDNGASLEAIVNVFISRIFAIIRPADVCMQGAGMFQKTSTPLRCTWLSAVILSETIDSRGGGSSQPAPRACPAPLSAYLQQAYDTIPSRLALINMLR